MSRIWMSGLEAGHLDVFDSLESTPTVTNAQARTGVYSLYFSTSAKGVLSALPASIAEIYGRFAVRVDTYHSGARTLLTFFDSGGDEQISLVILGGAGLLQALRGTLSGGTILGEGGVLPLSRWHCVEIYVKVDNAAGVVQVKIDGTQVINFAGDTQNTGNANVRSFGLGACQPLSAGLETYIDDIAFNDVAGGVNDSWIGRGGISAIFPTGAGASTDLDLFPNTGEANWEDVDEVPPDDDTSYVFDELVDDHDSYAASDLANAGTVSAVQWLARARSDFAGAPEIARILRIGGVDYQGADIAIDVGYDYHTEILDQDPDAGPGAWTKAAIDGMELGVKIR